MKVAKKVSVMGEWAKVNVDYRDGDILHVLNAGEITSSEFGEQKVFKVKTLKGEKNLAFNQTTMNNLIDAFGDETEKWNGESVKVTVVKAMIGGELKTVTYLSHPDWEMDEKGKFHGPDSQKTSEGEKVIQIAVPEVNPDDIPF